MMSAADVLQCMQLILMFVCAAIFGYLTMRFVQINDGNARRILIVMSLSMTVVLLMTVLHGAVRMWIPELLHILRTAFVLVTVLIFAGAVFVARVLQLHNVFRNNKKRD